MKRSIPDLEQQILDTANRLFLEKGILAVEMKDIADLVGISRSTLYRHYPDRLDIAFKLVQPMIVSLYDIPLTLPEDSSGYELTEFYLKELYQKLIVSPQQLRVMREFDTFYNSDTPFSPAMQEYEAFFREYRSPLYNSIVRGQEDGSIRTDIEANRIGYILYNCLIALAQRLLPRNEVYQREHGFGVDLIGDTLNVLLSGIRPEAGRK